MGQGVLHCALVLVVDSVLFETVFNDMRACLMIILIVFIVIPHPRPRRGMPLARDVGLARAHGGGGPTTAPTTIVC